MKRRKPHIAEKRTRINNRIRVPQVRLIDEEGNQLGVIETREAVSIAEKKGLDLVEVAPLAKPPVCRVMDFGKYLYDQRKRQRETKKSQSSSVIKEIKVGAKTEPHDIAFKLKHIRRFLSEKHRVKITVVFKGREISHSERGRALIDRIIAELGELATVETPAKLEGRMMSALLAPGKHKPARVKADAGGAEPKPDGDT
jgi:translation initiation factor IF-3